MGDAFEKQTNRKQNKTKLGILDYKFWAMVVIKQEWRERVDWGIWTFSESKWMPLKVYKQVGDIQTCLFQFQISATYHT